MLKIRIFVCLIVFKNFKNCSSNFQELQEPNPNNLLLEVDCDISNSEWLKIQIFLNDLFIHALSQDKAFFIIEEGILKDFFENIYGDLHTENPIITATLEDFNPENYGIEIIRSSDYVIIIMICGADLNNFFESISKSIQWGPIQWGPRNLIIINLNPKNKISDSLFSTSIQRSEHIFIAELGFKLNKLVIETYSIYAFSK